jgi:WD40 repeat protein
MNVARTFHSATLLFNGLVLVAGGEITSGNPTNTAEIYDPRNGTWRFTKFAMNSRRAAHTATLLLDGRVLIAGGGDGIGFLTSAEVFDPRTEKFSLVAPLHVPRTVSKAVLLGNGKVLVMGGYDTSPLSFSTTATAELFDPRLGTWSVAAPMPTSLLDGRVLVTGGESNGTFGLTSVSLYRPLTDSWKVMTPLLMGRQTHTATTLYSGKVLIVAGNDRVTPNNTVELYDVYAGASGQSSFAASIPGARVVHTAARLLDGNVLIVGGQDQSGFVLNAELYHWATQSWSDGGILTDGRAGSTATLLLPGKVLVTGGVTETHTGGTATNSAEVDTVPFSF